jgi:hypothetical protein
MKVYAAGLLILFNSISLNFLRLIMQLVALSKTITVGFSTEAHHSPKIFRKLSESIWRKLVNLYMKLNLNIDQHWLWRHPKNCGKKILKPSSVHTMKVQSQRARVMLFRESPHKYCRIGSLGSNLNCEGLLLVMRARGHGDPRARASPSEVNHSEPLLYDDTCDTPFTFFAGKVSYTVELQPSQGRGGGGSNGGLSVRR